VEIQDTVNWNADRFIHGSESYESIASCATNFKDRASNSRSDKLI